MDVVCSGQASNTNWQSNNTQSKDLTSKKVVIEGDGFLKNFDNGLANVEDPDFTLGPKDLSSFDEIDAGCGRVC